MHGRGQKSTARLAIRLACGTGRRVGRRSSARSMSALTYLVSFFVELVPFFPLVLRIIVELVPVFPLVLRIIVELVPFFLIVFRIIVELVPFVLWFYRKKPKGRPGWRNLKKNSTNASLTQESCEPI